MTERKFKCKDALAYGWDRGKKINGQKVLENPVYILFFVEENHTLAGEIHFVRSLRQLENSLLLRDPDACAQKMEEARANLSMPLPEKVEEQPQFITGDPARFLHNLSLRKNKTEEDFKNLQKRYASLEQRFEHYKKQVGDNGVPAFFKKMLLGPDDEQ